MSIQLSKSASLKSGGGRVTPESRINVDGMNCNINSTGEYLFLDFLENEKGLKKGKNVLLDVLIHSNTRVYKGK